MARGADTLRRMADTYASLAAQAKQFGRESEAAGYLRMWEELLTAAQEVEQKMRTGYEEPPHCTDGDSEFSVEKDALGD